MARNRHVEAADEFQGAYTMSGWGAGIAWYVDGWETEPDEDTEWSGYEVRTGKLTVHMVGDDKRFHVDPGDLTPIADEDFCDGCGQVGCGHGSAREG